MILKEKIYDFNVIILIGLFWSGFENLITDRRAYERGYFLFGYVRPYKPEMKIKDFEIFQSVYCGLCHTLQKRYGIPARLILSYDATFLAIIRMSVSGGCTGVQRKRCPFLLFRKKPCCCGGEVELSFSADVSVLLFYYKLKDYISDSGFLKKLAGYCVLPFIAHMHKKAAKRQPEAEEILRNYMKEQKQVEAVHNDKIDQAAHPTAQMVSKVLPLGVEDRDTARILERLGYFLGRWIYFMDAADDVEKDEKTGNYNIFMITSSQGEVGDTKQKAIVLNPCIAEIVGAFELLNLKGLEAVVQNMIYLGLPQMQKSVLFKTGKQCKRVERR